MSNKEVVPSSFNGIGNFGDTRLLIRGKKIMELLYKKLSFNIKKLSGGNRAEEVAIHRFLENKYVEMTEIENTITEETNQNCLNLDHVLIINDTTEFAYPSQQEKKAGLGPTGNKNIKGLFLHPNLVVNPDTGLILGLAGANIWYRTDEGTRDARAKKAIEDKESFKWIDSYNRAKNLSNPKKRTFVTDRESDIYEYMDIIQKNNDFFALRYRHDRKLEANNTGKISDQITSSPVQEVFELEIPETPKRKPRKASIALKFGELCILRPKKLINKEKYSESITINYVDVEESIDTAPDEKSKVHWRVLTNHKVSTVQEAKEIISYYKNRWIIEMLFAVNKKKGLNIESSQIEDFDKLQKFILMALHASTKVFHLLKARDGVIKSKASIVFSEHELYVLTKILLKVQGKTVKQTNPYTINSMAWASWIIARLGGWNCYGKTRPPGIHIFSRGLQKFNDMYEGAKLLCI